MKKLVKAIMVLLIGLSTLSSISMQVQAEDSHTFTMAINYMPTSLLPTNSGSDDYTSMIRPIYDQLYIQTRDGYEYYLAKAVEVSEDGLKLKVTLRDDVFWSDGQPITTEDVKFRIDYENNKRGGTSSYNTIEDEKVEINVVDQQVIEFVLPKPFLAYNKQIGAIIPLPAHVFDGDVTKVESSDYFTKPEITTSGAFKVAEINDDSIVYVARDDYYRGRPQVDKIVLKTIGAGTTKQIAFENGEISYMRVTNKADLEKYTAQPEKYHIYSLPEGRLNYIRFNSNSPKKFTLEQRKAMTMAINLEEIVKVAYGDDRLATIANSALTPEMSLYNADNQLAKYDVEAAKKLAEESGLSGQTLTYVFNKDRANMEQVATVIQQQLAQIGVTLEVEALDSPTFFDRFFATIYGTGLEDTWDLGSNGYDGMVGQTLGYVYTLYAGDSYKGTELYDLVRRIYQTTSSEEAKKLADEFQSKQVEVYDFLPISYSNYVMVSQKNVTGLDQQPIVPEFIDWMTIKVE